MSAPAPRRRGRHAPPEDDLPGNVLPGAWWPDERGGARPTDGRTAGTHAAGTPAAGAHAVGAEGTARLPGLRAVRFGPPPPAPRTAEPRTVAADLAGLQARHRGTPDPDERSGERWDDRADRDSWDGDRWDGDDHDGRYDDPRGGRSGPGLPPGDDHHDEYDDARPDRYDDDRYDDHDSRYDGDHGGRYDDERDDDRYDDRYDGDPDDGHGGRDDDGHDDEHDDFDYDAVPFYDEVEGGRRRRRPVSIVLSLLVLAALVAGVAVGGTAIYRKVNPTAKDFTGTGTGSVQVRVQTGDTLSDIGRTLVNSGVIASSKPFLDAADGQPSAKGIQPGVYGLREHMSGASALQQLLDPKSRLFSRVTLPEGMTVTQVLQKLADGTETPLADLKAAAADTGSLGLPAGVTNLEGYLFPATYDFEPKTPPADMLRAMVQRSEQAMNSLGVTAEQRNSVLTEASIVQAEASSTGDMAKVARVLDNRLAAGMPLQLDTTVNYANGKTGITTTAEDRANPSPYNTYLHPGLPPGPISNPGEDAIKAVLAPAPGDWLFFVVVDPDTGETRFARTAAEHQQNVLLFQQWLRDHPGG